MNYDEKRKFITNTAFFAIVLFIVYIISKFMTVYLMPLIVGIAVSMAMQRPVDFLSRKTRTKRVLWSVVLVALSFGIIVFLLIFSGIKLYSLLVDVTKMLPDYLPVLADIFENIGDAIAPVADKIPQGILSAVETIPETAITSLTDTLTTKLSQFASGVISAAPALLITFFVSFIASCYITRDYHQVKAFVKRQIPEKHLPMIASVKTLFRENVAKMLKGYLIIMGITFLELAAGFYIIGVRPVLAPAAIIALVDILPVLGVGTVLLPWALFKMITGEYTFAISLLAVYLIITVVRSIIEPKIISKQMGLNPLVTLLAMYCGLKLFGLLGLIGLPIALIIVTALQREGKIHIWN